MTKFGLILLWNLWPWALLLTLTFCLVIAFVIGNYSWWFYNETMTGTLSKSWDRQTERQTHTSVLYIWYKYKVESDAVHSAPIYKYVIFMLLCSLISSLCLVWLLVFYSNQTLPPIIQYLPVIQFLFRFNNSIGLHEFLSYRADSMRCSKTTYYLPPSMANIKSHYPPPSSADNCNLFWVYVGTSFYLEWPNPVDSVTR